MAKRELMKKVNSAVFPGTQGGPLMHVIAGKAVAFGEALQPEFKEYCAQVLNNANAMAIAYKNEDSPWYPEEQTIISCSSTCLMKRS